MSLDERIKYASMKARHKDELRPWYKKWWGIVIIIITALLLIFVIASGIYIVKKIQTINNGTDAKYLEEQRQSYLDAVNGKNVSFWGPEDAPITIIEFSDFACPYCQESYIGLKAIRKKYEDKVKIIYRDYPLHDNSIFLSLSAKCAGEQGKFWEMHDKLFKSQEDLTNDSIKKIANDLRLDMEAFNDCYDNDKYQGNIQKDLAAGVKAGVEGTPTLFINGEKFAGVIPKSILEQILYAIEYGGEQ